MAGSRLDSQQRLIGRDGIGDAHMPGGIHVERAHHFFGHERIVVDFRESLRRGHVSDAAQIEHAKGSAGGTTDSISGARGVMDS